MPYCTSCGKKIENSKFCTSCGAKHAKKEATQRESKFLPILLIVAFIGVLALIITSLTQDNSSEDVSLTPLLPEEKVVGLNVPAQQNNNQAEQRREGYELNAKPFDERKYEYDERTNDFRLVCSKPCPVSKDIINQEFAAISYAVSTLRGLTKSDLDENIVPFEVHASEDSVCPTNPDALAYMTVFTDAKGYNRGLLCFFFDKLRYDRSKFPYSTSVHEVTHLFEAGKIKHNSVLWEGLSEMLESFFVKGNDRNSFCWEGNAWYKDVIKRSDDPHWVGGDLFFELCRQYGFDYNDLPELFRQLDSRGGNVDENVFVGIVNNIVDSDTSQLFRKAGVI